MLWRGCVESGLNFLCHKDLGDTNLEDLIRFIVRTTVTFSAKSKRSSSAGSFDPDVGWADRHVFTVQTRHMVTFTATICHMPI